MIKCIEVQAGNKFSKQICRVGAKYPTRLKRYVTGANIAAFEKITKAMSMQDVA